MNKKSILAFWTVMAVCPTAIGNPVGSEGLLYAALTVSQSVQKEEAANSKQDTKSEINDTVFDLASVTKPTGTTLSLMRLVESGQVDLKANIGTYLTDFDPSEITVEELLTHTICFPNYHGYVKADDYRCRAESRQSQGFRCCCVRFAEVKISLRPITLADSAQILAKIGEYGSKFFNLSRYFRIFEP